MRRRFALATAAACLFAALPAGAVGELPSEPPASDPQAGFDDRTLLVKTSDPKVHAAVEAGEVVNRIDPLGIDVVQVPPGTVEEAVAEYAERSAVEWAEPNWRAAVQSLPNDPMLRNQWGFGPLQIVEAWQRYGSRWAPPGGARLAIIDTGIDTAHPEFGKGKIIACRSWTLVIGAGASGCSDDHSHGTHVAGIAAALAHNQRGIAGVAPDASLLVLKAFGPSGHGFTADIAAAIVYAADHGAQVANYSFGLQARSNAQADAIAYAARRGVVQVAAVGNDPRKPVQFPAQDRHVIGVAATTPEDRLAGFSARGHGAELAAPGAGILSTLPGSLVYGRMSGTSMAAPHVAGVATLLRARGLDPLTTRRVLRASADPIAEGAWRLNAGAALRHASLEG